MKRILIPLLFLTIAAHASTMPVYATSGHSVQQIQSMSVCATSYMPTYEMRSMCVIPSGAHYTGTVYEPFNSAAPSEYTEGASSSGGPRRGKKWDSGGFIIGPDTPPGQESPVGEPWILLLFAAAFGGYIVWKKKKVSTTSKEEI